jgi:3-hydroxymyristoyl/3-hydroxydecanoyl-(acyl carrier protein) dehydratase
MRYLLVDRVLEVQRGPEGAPVRGRGLKAVSRWDPLLRRAASGVEVSPCIVGEAIGQLAAWLVKEWTGFTRRPVAGLTAEAVVLGPARPGDLLLLEVEVESLDETAVGYSGRALAGEAEVLQVHHAVGPLLPLEEFEDPAEARRRWDSLRASGAIDESMASYGRAPAAPARELPEWPSLDHPAIDAVLERDPDRLVAVTAVSHAAPYLVEHFPRRPVLPATLLLDAGVTLAAILAGGDGREARVGRVMDLKMREFVRPGNRVVTEASVRSRGEESTVVDLRSRIASRPVASARVEVLHSRQDR